MLVPVGRHGDEDLPRSDIAARGVWLTLALDWFGFGPFAARRFRPMALIWFQHDLLLVFGQLAKPRRGSTLLIGINRSGDRL